MGTLWYQEGHALSQAPSENIENLGVTSCLCLTEQSDSFCGGGSNLSKNGQHEWVDSFWCRSLTRARPFRSADTVA